MTKHRDVNKCRRKDKCKMAALIRQANKRYEMAKKKERTYGGKQKKDKKEEKKEQTNKQTNKQNGRAKDAYELPHTKTE